MDEFERHDVSQRSGMLFARCLSYSPCLNVVKYKQSCLVRLWRAEANFRKTHRRLILALDIIDGGVGADSGNIWSYS